MADNKPTKITLVAVGKQMNEALATIVALHQMLAAKDIGEVYGIPTTSFQEKFTFAPQIILRFYQRSEDKINKNLPSIDAEHSIRLIGKKSETINDFDVDLLKAKIKSKFGGNTPFFYEKGKEKYVYFDKSKDYDIRINAFDEINARKLVEQLLDIQGHSPEWEFLSKTTSSLPQKKYDDTPGSSIILGRAEKKPRKRPLGRVTFARAELHLYGKPLPVVLAGRGAVP